MKEEEEKKGDLLWAAMTPVSGEIRRGCGQWG